jgi:nucleoside-diphosphate-sugar epimerase
VIRGCEAVVHLAAVPNPGVTTPEELFRVNSAGTFNVFQAAAEEGIKRVVQASSINAAGQFYGVKPAPLHYLPLDEEHPVFSTDAYSFSKHIIEETGAYFWRREGISSVAFRLPWVAPASMHGNIEQRREVILKLTDQLLKLSMDERSAWFNSAWKLYNDFRATRPYEKPGGFGYRAFNDMPEDIRAKVSAMGYRVNFYTMLDERDSAQAVEKGLTASFDGAHALFINDHLNWTGVDSNTLAQLYYPDVRMFRRELPGCASLVSIAKARKLIGFEPEYSFGKGLEHA